MIIAVNIHSKKLILQEWGLIIEIRGWLNVIESWEVWGCGSSCGSGWIHSNFRSPHSCDLYLLSFLLLVVHMRHPLWRVVWITLRNSSVSVCVWCWWPVRITVCTVQCTHIRATGLVRDLRCTFSRQCPTCGFGTLSSISSTVDLNYEPRQSDITDRCSTYW